MNDEVKVVSVVIKRGDSWFYGRVKKSGKFKIKRAVKKLEDIKDVDDYKSLGECLRGDALQRALKKMKATQAFYLLKDRREERENAQADNQCSV